MVVAPASRPFTLFKNKSCVFVATIYSQKSRSAEPPSCDPARGMTRQERRAAARQSLKDLQKQLKNGTAPPNARIAEQPGSGISEARLAANRANAQLSTGPATPAGKAASSQNSFKHGLYSKQIVIKGEDPA